MPRIIHGDCREVMQTFEENSIDSVVTDPPYGLSFMGKEWDHGIPGTPFWEETLRVCKPGAHMLAFGGTRTFHRLTCAIEDSGWEIRDCLGWMYGSGFPKSVDISKAIDKAAGVEREIIGYDPTKARPNRKYLTGAIGTIGGSESGIICDRSDNGATITAPATESAIQWQGWGTALKPAWEPIILCRKPLEGTVSENVLKWGTGGLNIDTCRIGNEIIESGRANRGECITNSLGKRLMGTNEKQYQKGRFPANLIHDGSDEVLSLFPQTESNSGTPFNRNTNKFPNCYGKFEGIASEEGYYGDSGSAARFFYTAKADSAERNKYLKGLPPKKVNDGRETPIDNAFQRGETLRKNTHPTVKPVDLLRYLCRLITPPKGIILDPFAGSGSTGVAAFEEGFDSILIEIEEEYYQIAKIRNAQTRLP